MKFSQSGIHFSLRVLSVLLRSATLLSRFLLIFFLAKYLSPKDVGLYGLLAGTISYALFFVGFEFYTFSTRELICSDKRMWLFMIRDQAVFFIFTYLFALPFFLIIFFKGWLPWPYAGWFIVLLILEHVAQELNRLLVAMSFPLFASVVSFLRSGAWCLLLVFIMWQVPNARNLKWVMCAWSAGVGLACLLGLTRIFRLESSELSTKVDWRWIGKGLKVAGPLLIASLSIRGLFTFDRYWVESIAGLEVLGAYVLFMGLSNSIVAFLESGVVIFLYPEIVAAARSGDEDAFLNGMSRLLKNVLLVTFSLVAILFFISRPLLEWLGQDLYLQNFFFLKWLLLAITLYSFSLVPHVGLYAHSKDKVILLSQILGLATFILGVYFGKEYCDVLAVPIALCLTFFVIFVWKLIAYCLMRDSRLVMGDG